MILLNWKNCLGRSHNLPACLPIVNSRLALPGNEGEVTKGEVELSCPVFLQLCRYMYLCCHMLITGFSSSLANQAREITLAPCWPFDCLRNISGVYKQCEGATPSQRCFNYKGRTTRPGKPLSHSLRWLMCSWSVHRCLLLSSLVTWWLVPFVSWPCCHLWQFQGTYVLHSSYITVVTAMQQYWTQKAIKKYNQ